MKKILFLLVGVMMFLSACGGDSSNDNVSGDSSNSDEATDQQVQAEEKEEPVNETVPIEEFYKVSQNPADYINANVEFYGRIFVEPEKDNDGTYLQLFADADNNQNVIVAINDPNLDVATEDIVYVTGHVHDVYEGENALGGTVSGPMIWADTIEVTDYATAFAQANQIIEVDEEKDHNGYKLSLQKVELADDETRLYIKVTNNTENSISFYSFNAKIVANDVQLDEQSNYQADYPEVQSSLLPDTSSEGIITFPEVPEDTESLKIHLEGSSDDWDLDIDPFVFEVSID